MNIERDARGESPPHATLTPNGITMHWTYESPTAVDPTPENLGNRLPHRNRYARALRIVVAGFLLLPLLPSAGLARELGAATMAARAASAVGSSTDPIRVAEKGDSLALVSEFDVNGLKVLVKEREGSQTVVVSLYLRGGATNVTEQNAGIEALMLEVATEASENFPRERFRRELSSIGTEISSSVGYDYSALTMSSTRVHFDRSWEIFTDAAMHPSFAPEDFQRVKNRLVAGLRSSQDSPDAYLQTLQARASYAGHPYANDPQGTPESVGRLTVEDVRRYHADAMQTSRLLLVVVGDLDPQEIRRRVEASFGRLPRGDYQSSPVRQLAYEAPGLAVTQRDLRTNYVQGIFAAPPITSPDYFAMRVAASILQSRVYEEVRVRRNLSYAPDAFLWNQGANAGGIYVTAEDANRAVTVMLNEIGRLQREPVSPRELSATAQHFLTQHYLREETNAAQARVLAQYELIGGGWRNSEQFMERVRAVTPQDVQRVARTYMQNLQFVVLGDPRAIDRTVFTGRAP